MSRKDRSLDAALTDTEGIMKNEVLIAQMPVRFQSEWLTASEAARSIFAWRIAPSSIGHRPAKYPLTGYPARGGVRGVSFPPSLMLCFARHLPQRMESHSMRRESKSTTGSVVKDRRSQTWQFFWWADGKRHSKTLGRFPTKTTAWKAAQAFRIEAPQPQPLSASAPTVAVLVEQYRAEKMPTRVDTGRTYNAWLKNHIVPQWGACEITTLQARPAELWLQSLPLSPKSCAHIRAALRGLWDFAMWRGDIPTQRNPMELVTIRGASKRQSKPRSLTVAEFQEFVAHLKDPFFTIALVCVCFGLRISEALALQWSDVDWLGGKLRVERGIVPQNVDNVKTDESRKSLTIANDVLDVLKRWKQTTQFPAQALGVRFTGETWLVAVVL
jgi:integrase